MRKLTSAVVLAVALITPTVASAHPLNMPLNTGKRALANHGRQVAHGTELYFAGLSLCKRYRDTHSVGCILTFEDGDVTCTEPAFAYFPNASNRVAIYADPDKYLNCEDAYGNSD